MHEIKIVVVVVDVVYDYPLSVGPVRSHVRILISNVTSSERFK